MKSLSYKQFVCVILAFISLPVITFSQDTKTFTDPEKLFTARLPSAWQNEMQSKSNKFSLHPEGNNEKKIVLQVGALPKLISDMTLKEMGEGALDNLKKDAKKGKAVINNNGYVTINGTEWFMIDFSDKTARNIIYLTILDKKKYRYFYTAPLNEYDKDIVTANAVINSVQFGRSVENLTGNESGPDTKNIASNSGSGNKISDTKTVNNTVIAKQSGDTGNPVQKDNNIPSAAVEFQPSNTTIAQEKTFQDFLDFNFKNEAEYIKKYGNGKVTRISEHEIEFTLISGKKFVLKDPYDAPMKSYERLGIFIGYSDELNKFMLATEDGHLFGVDRATGSYKGLGLDIPNLYTLKDGSWSPDRKWLAICYGDLNEEGNAEISVFSGQFPYKKLYSKYTSENGKGWGAGVSKWLDNNTLEIQKMDILKSPHKQIGTTWLTLQTGKWILQSTKPAAIKAGANTETGKTPAASISSKHVNIKPYAINTTSVFTGNIAKRWQAACSLTNKLKFSSTREKLFELELFPGGKFNIYDKGVITGTGKYTLATDKKSMLLSGGGQNMTAKILRLTNEDMILDFKGVGTMLLYPINTPRAKAALRKREAYLKLVDKSSDYLTPAVKFIYYLNQLISDFDQKPFLSTALHEQVKADCKKNMNYVSSEDYLFINDYLDWIYLIRNDAQMVRDAINNNSSLQSNSKITEQLDAINKEEQAFAANEDELIKLFNEYFKY